MQAANDIHQLHEALIINFRLKAKILAILFGVVLILQLIAMSIVIATTDLAGKVIPLPMMLTGPPLLLLIFLSEIAAFRYLKKIQGNSGQVKNSFIYLSTFVEVSFPCAIMFMVGSYLRGTTLFPPMQIVNSPLLMILFIMIILSSLLLDPRLSLFAGCVAGIEYLVVNILFLWYENDMGPSGYPNAILKSLLLIVAGLIAGFVSRKVREAIVASLHSKNELIHHLDKRVAEKTAEVVAQKDEIEKKNEMLEVKQKEILDSIHYARRIQHTQLPTEKYIVKNLDRLKGS